MAGLDDRLGPLIGKRSADRLAKAFGYLTVRDLLGHYPRRLDDRGDLTDIGALHLGEQVTILGRVKRSREFRFTPKDPRRGSGIRIEVEITDGNADITATFFGTKWRVNQLSPGTVAYFSGRVDQFRGHRQLVHPAVDVLGAAGGSLDPDAVPSVDDDAARRWWPVYPAVQSLTSFVILRCVRALLAVVDPIPDFVPSEVRLRHGLLSLDDAVRRVHMPEDRDEFYRAQRRLRHDEAFVLETLLVQRRVQARDRRAVARPRSPGGLLERFDASLPFVLTAGQRAAGEQIAHDIEQDFPMQRLLQGEVGSGKTVVALRAMLQVVDAGGQAALLAPTGVLAHQHYRSITEILGPLAGAGMLGGSEEGTRVALLTGATPAAARREVLSAVQTGDVGILVGTHALLQESVGFAELGLVVVDEQHWFGVEQRSALVEKGGESNPHLLVMTATPIPRTVAMTVFGDLDTSELHELPLGRASIQTTVVPAEHPSWLARAWQRVREEVAAGHQAYVVCARIGERAEAGMHEALVDDFTRRSEPLGVSALADELTSGPLAGLRLAVLHGRLPADEKDRVMRSFADGGIDVLVSTTVIEVGVDVPNATVMLVMDADRFGVSSLHQLRGRIGRGAAPGLCLLVTEAPADSASRLRLDALAATSDGFELAQLDLETRSEGDVLGALQSGRRSSLRLLSVVRDARLIAEAREDAERVLSRDPELLAHPGLAAEVRRMSADDRAEFLEKT